MIMIISRQKITTINQTMIHLVINIKYYLIIPISISLLF